MSTASQRIAAFTVGLRLQDVPAETVLAAKLHALDALGCGLAASAMGEAAFAVGAALEVASAGPATAIGLPGGLPASEAVLVNGTLCHALDYDDTHPDSIVHVSAAVTPAGLAAGEIAGSSGSELLCALVAGNETSIRLGAAAGGRFHARGLHPTGVCGIFGATVTAARLRGLDEERTAHALGIAGSMAGGLLEFLSDGAKTKPLHPGWAAHGALAAVRLAAHGATGPASVLEGRRGFFAAYLHGESPELEGQLADLGARFATPRIAFKPYPACHYTHAPIDALAEILARDGLDPAEIEWITALSDETGVGLVLHPLEDKLRPRTPYDAKFSLPYCLGALLVHGRVDVASFTAEAVRDPAVLSVASRVDYEQRAYSAAPDAFPGGVRVRMRDGREHEAELRHQRGGTENPMSTAEVLEKFCRNAILALPAAVVSELETAMLSLESLESLAPLAVLGRARRCAEVAFAAGAEVRDGAAAPCAPSRNVTAARARQSAPTGAASRSNAHDGPSRTRQPSRERAGTRDEEMT
jgi:2-methylcitrate dehydratase PrpD